VPVHQWKGFADAPTIAEELLGGETMRFRHSRGVAAAAARASAAVPREDVDLLVAAAWLHDVGYAASLSGTGFHPLDGARYLRAIGAPERLCRLVAHHTGARVEAANRGLLDTLMQEFPPEESETAEALTYADLTTGPKGSPVSALERVMEILIRYPPNHVVHESIQHTRSELLEIAARVDTRLAGIRLQVGNVATDADLARPSPTERRVGRGADRSST
jgi:putative nucleotidyltransferase with HDIG domain